MRIYRSVLAAMGGLVVAGLGTASAGPILCGASGASVCNPGVAYTSSPIVNSPMGVNYRQPYDHLKSVIYKQTPNQNILRVQTGAPMAQLSDAPRSYWGGCQGGGASYCMRPAPIRSAPIRPVMRPSYTQLAAPAVRVGSGYNAANFASRQYGSNVLTPGTAYIPTSIVNRSVTDRDALLASGRAVAQTIARPGMTSVSSVQSSYRASSGGSYWENVSTAGGNVLCKRQAPAVTRRAYQVVRPIIRVPVPVPTPVACGAPVPGPRLGFGPAPRPMPMPMGYGHRGLTPALSAYEGNGTWTY